MLEDDDTATTLDIVSITDDEGEKVSKISLDFSPFQVITVKLHL